MGKVRYVGNENTKNNKIRIVRKANHNQMRNYSLFFVFPSNFPTKHGNNYSFILNDNVANTETTTKRLSINLKSNE